MNKECKCKTCKCPLGCMCGKMKYIKKALMFAMDNKVATGLAAFFILVAISAIFN